MEDELGRKIFPIPFKVLHLGTVLIRDLITHEEQ